MIPQTTFLHDRYPALGKEPVPIEPYISEDFHAREKRHVFKKTWIHVGRIEELPERGNYLVKDLKCIDSSIIVSRDHNGELYAMHNVCAHRMNRIACPGHGKTRRFFCRFHGWSYGLDGALKGVPDELSFFDFDKSKLGLARVHVDTWQGFIFINVADKPEQRLGEFMGSMYSTIEGYPFAAMTNCYSWQAVVKCNWKLALDAFQEAYHVAYVHGNSIADALWRDTDGNLRPLDGLCGDYHRRLSMGGNPKSVYGNPNAATDMDVDAKDAIDMTSSQQPIAAAALRLGKGGSSFEASIKDLPEGLNWTKHPNWAFDINMVFPDFYLSLRPNYYQAYNFRPLTHNTFLFDARVYYPEAKTAGGRFYQEYMKVALRDVLLEDLSTLEETQAATETNVMSHMVLQDYEIMVRHQHHVIRQMIDRGEAQ
jgi:phenylpropionate dioxygenase-like ring-hydroxylating dioxygenase large terminal subunit|tara:strand:- start:2852 stop:4126 length:1275 start_codon:yes stop_codon:yes gene_type:complete